ncbi:hypothetical protein TVAG_493010 [Trichomonas vaginalis G3]|uniref:Uncharacterized protein n=1 Tax=Trichomonas vaginalis (strain ATCC PRA-98 / G3) TaxID=412133 RepID=A2FUU4_TRIV3|nr:hypothetical protein TVAG_493010 [Trichomonas vaginalis G3]|eukprot:XP_001304263.1 hypothetical protein [Trichomonas vaginalis G3]
MIGVHKGTGQICHTALFLKKINGAERYSAAGAPRLPIITKGSLRAPENPSAEAFSFGLC